MDETGDTAVLEVPIWVENDLETDGGGSVYVVSYVAVGGSDDPTEVRVPLEGIVDNLIEFSEATAGNIQTLYTIAHELARYADQLRTTADRLEGLWPEEDDFIDDLDDDEPVDR